MTTEITVFTGARLHFGLLAHGGTTQREFGGAGVMIDQPGFVLRGTVSARERMQGGAAWQSRLESLVARYRQACPPRYEPLPVSLEIVSAPPPHVGLGSGTQLGLAVSKLLSLLAGEPSVPVVELARRAGRGARSAVGLYGFEQGGFILEAGKRQPAEISPLVARVAVPPEWRFVLVRPRETAGLAGAAEAETFGELPPLPAATSDRLCGLAVRELIPALASGDCAQFGEAVFEFGRIVGEYFATVQGGTIADPQMRDLAMWLRSQGFRGVGQTSWGPTLFVLCADRHAASRLVAELGAHTTCSSCELTVAAPLNRGATWT